MSKGGDNRLVVLISGRGSNFAALADACADDRVPGQVAAVISDRAEAEGLVLAQSRGIDTILIDRTRHPSRFEFETSLAAAIDGLQPRYIVLAGFMRVLGGDLVSRYADRMINVHPSLLPSYRGLHTHRRVLEAGDTEHGASVHFVTPALDGGPVISQVTMPVEPGDTPGRLAERLLPLEHRLLPATMALLLTQTVECRDETIFIDDHPLARPLRLGHDLADPARPGEPVISQR